MATSNVNARFFSQDAVCCVLRGLTPLFARDEKGGRRP